MINIRRLLQIETATKMIPTVAGTKFFEEILEIKHHQVKEQWESRGTTKHRLVRNFDGAVLLASVVGYRIYGPLTETQTGFRTLRLTDNIAPDTDKSFWRLLKFHNPIHWRFDHFHPVSHPTVLVPAFSDHGWKTCLNVKSRFRPGKRAFTSFVPF